MKNKISKKIICLAAAAVILTAGFSVGKALAYFTTYTEGKGGVALELGFTETIPQEKVEDGMKKLTVKNTGDFECYVRVKALTGDAYSVKYEEADGAGKWTPGADGFYYYSEILPAGSGETSQLNVIIPKLKEEAGEEPAGFNVIIIQECTPVLYKDGGEPYADWSKVADVSRTVAAGEEGAR